VTARPATSNPEVFSVKDHALIAIAPGRKELRDLTLMVGMLHSAENRIELG